jgi:hypothetical protein
MSFNSVPNRVFISYAREDERYAKRLYDDIKSAGLDPWLDKECILPGEDWKISIRKGIRESRYFIPLLSSNSVERRGYVQKELKQALDILEEISPSGVFVIPVRLDDCKVSSKRINSRHIEDLSKNWDQGIKRILKSMGVAEKPEEPDGLDIMKEKQWFDLISLVDEKNCIPFIGEEISSKWIPLSSNISSEWAKQYGYPFEDTHNIQRVSQFVTFAYNDNLYSKRILSKYLREKKVPDFSLIENKDTPYAILANLNLPVYVTANFDHCMEIALEENGGKEPVSEFCRWNEKLRNYADDKGLGSAFDSGKNYLPSSAKPLVYHLIGDMNVPQSMVLTERDYFDFVINMNNKPDALFPAIIKRSFASNPFMFLGCDFNNVYFRLVLESFLNNFKSMDVSNWTVLNPISAATEKSEAMEQYLEKYLKNNSNSVVYWQNAFEFFPMLHRRLDSFRRNN